MFYSDVNNDESSVPYQPVQESTIPVDSVSHWSEDQTMPPTNAIPPYQPPPATPPPGGKRPSRGLRTGAIIALTVLLAVVFGTGLFAGWQFGHSSSTAVATPSTGTSNQLQTNPTPQPIVPALSGNNLEAVREAVVAKVTPTVVQINVTNAQGSGIGSGVIIDKRGYIVTNNHVVSGAQSVQVVMSDGFLRWSLVLVFLLAGNLVTAVQRQWQHLPLVPAISCRQIQPHSLLFLHFQGII